MEVRRGLHVGDSSSLIASRTRSRASSSSSSSTPPSTMRSLSSWTAVRCGICTLEVDDDGQLLRCDGCDAPFHLGCAEPPLHVAPEQWNCLDCWQLSLPLAQSSALPPSQEDSGEMDVDEAEDVPAVLDEAEEKGDGLATGEPSDDDDEDDPLKSAKWLPYWALHRLSARQLRLVIEGRRQADSHSAAAAGGSAMESSRAICTSGVGFRDQLVHACLHAGYSAHFSLNRRAGEVCGYRPIPGKGARGVYTAEAKEAALLLNPAREFDEVRGQHDSWWVCYTEEVHALLPGRDVRFDGSDCVVRQKEGERWGMDGPAHRRWRGAAGSDEGGAGSAHLVFIRSHRVRA